MDKGFNYARFYALLKQLPGADKETLVEQYTGGRTTHLRQMTIKEYELMCSIICFTNSLGVIYLTFS